MPTTSHDRVVEPAALDRASVLDPDTRVRIQADANSTLWASWKISQNLTDRWGEINYANATNKPLRTLIDDPTLLERLRAQMWDEITFIARKDDHYGLLYEVEFASQESEERNGVIDPDLLPHTDMIATLLAALPLLRCRFPGIEFAIPDESEIYNARPAIWAFVRDGQLDQAKRAELGHALLDPGKLPELKLSPRAYDHADFEANPEKYRLFVTARIARLPRPHSPRLKVGQLVGIRFLETAFNTHARCVMPLYVVHCTECTPRILPEQAITLFADALAEYCL